MKFINTIIITTNGINFIAIPMLISVYSLSYPSFSL